MTTSVFRFSVSRFIIFYYVERDRTTNTGGLVEGVSRKYKQSRDDALDYYPEKPALQLGEHLFPMMEIPERLTVQAERLGLDRPRGGELRFSD